MSLKRGTPGQHGWTHGPDGDPVHRDWTHTLDGDYQPKNARHTIDGDLIIPENPSTAHLPKESGYL